MENEFEKTDNTHEKDLEIVIHYKVKNDPMIYKTQLSPYEYYWNLTSDIIENSYRDAIEMHSDYRDYIVDRTDLLLEEIEFLIAIVKNPFLKETKSYYSFFYDDKMLSFVQTHEFDVIPDISVIYSMFTDQCYDIARIDVNPVTPISECYSSIRISRLMATNDDDVLIDLDTSLSKDEIYGDLQKPL